ncbi:MAG: MFS transporter [Thermoplasmata archaeon]|nr:MFS transporter [Thermoplasmata archaeon]
MSRLTALPASRRRGPAAALFVSRVVYAFNWYNVGAVLPLIGVGLSAGTERLGLVLGAFLIGVGVFQVPAGFAALRYGARKVSLWGLALFGAAGVASAFSPSIAALAGLRFVAGVGAALFFSPALSLIASYYPPGERGPVIGLYNGGFSLGGALGLFLGAWAGVTWGWPFALGVGGGVLLVSTAAAAVLLPPTPEDRSPRSVADVRRRGVAVLRSRALWALSLALTGFWAAIYIVAQYFVQFVHDARSAWGVGVGAALAAMVVIVSFPGGPLGGWVAERAIDRRLLAGVLAAVAALCVIAVPWMPLWALWPLFALLGLVDGMAFAVLYLIPAYLPETQGDDLALGVAVVNSIQVLIGSALAVAFGFLAASRGYPFAWLIAGILALAPLPLLALVPETVAPDPATRTPT